MNHGSIMYSIELEPEVREWLAALPPDHYARGEAHADHLAGNAETLGEPYSRHLGIGPPVVLLMVLPTVFGKTRQRQHDEVGRAAQAQKACEAGHDVADTIWTR